MRLDHEPAFTPMRPDVRWHRGHHLNHLYGGQFARLEEWLSMRAGELFDVLGSNWMLFGEWCAAQHSLD
jgi:hypothetical protein